jgi:hypothetical protein
VSADVVNLAEWREKRKVYGDREEVAAFAAHCAARIWSDEHAEREYLRVMSSDAAYEEWRGLMASRYRVVAETLQFWDAFGLYQDL